MSKIKKQTAEIKKAVHSANECPSKPSFSFEHLTNNDSFTFDYFAKDKRARNAAKTAVYDKLEKISREDWIFWYNQGKIAGIETIPANQINFEPYDYSLSDDGKVIVFRFSYDGNDCRILGITKSPCPIYYVIGFDFNHNAYDHGS